MSSQGMLQRLGRKFDRNAILREKNAREVAHNAFGIALELALLGYVESATQLYNLFQSFNQYSRSLWSPALYFAWEATGLWPESIPADERTPQALKKLETERILWKRETNATADGLASLLARATGDGRTDEYGEMQIREDDLIAAVDLALYMGKDEKAIEILKIFADNFHLTWADLGKSRLVWKLLRDKTLARLIEVDEEKMAKFQNEVYSTFKERIDKGALRIYQDTPMKELVEMCNRNTLKNAVWEEMAMDTDDAEPPDTILRPGASKEEIAELEKRIGHQLPDDYKEFLAATNGMGSYWNGFYGEPALLGTKDVHVFDATEQQNVWNDASVNIPFVTDMSVKAEWPTLDRVLQINAANEESLYVWLIPPEYSRAMGASFFAAFGQLPAEEKAQVTKMLEYYHKGRQTADGLGWIVCCWNPQTMSLVNYDTIKEFWEDIAADSANADLLGEEDDQGRLLHSHDVFAYSLR